MRHYADIAVYGRDGLLKLLVEAKGKQGASSEWAARLRQNMYAHGQLPHVPYFLLALPDRFYLWREVEDLHMPIMPHYRADALPLLRPYLERAGTPSRKMTEQGLELAVSAWLEKLVGNHGQLASPQGGQWLHTSGLLDAIRGGRVEVQTLV